MALAARRAQMDIRKEAAAAHSLEYSRDRRAANPMTDVLESTLDPRV
jgi:hypothetical protein